MPCQRNTIFGAFLEASFVDVRYSFFGMILFLFIFATLTFSGTQEQRWTFSQESRIDGTSKEKRNSLDDGMDSQDLLYWKKLHLPDTHGLGGDWRTFEPWRYWAKSWVGHVEGFSIEREAATEGGRTQPESCPSVERIAQHWSGRSRIRCDDEQRKKKSRIAYGVSQAQQSTAIQPVATLCSTKGWVDWLREKQGSAH